MGARFCTVAALASIVMAVQPTARAEGTGQPLYAVMQIGTGARELTQLDPGTLASVGPGASLGASGQAAAFSADGSLLAVVQWTDRPSLRILELPRMRWRPEVPLDLTTGTVLVRWLGSSRLVVLAEQPDGLRALIVDAKANRLVGSTRIPGHLSDRRQVDVGRTRVAVLLKAKQAIGGVRVAVVSSSGSARTVTIDLIREGAKDRALYRPSLVASASADRAYVVGGIDESVATVNLRTLAVSYRRPFGSANAARFTGEERMSVWLGNGRFGVAGWDDGAAGGDSRVLGLRVVDTRSWRARVLDRDSDLACVAGHSVVTHHPDGTLVVFGFDGRRRLTFSLADRGMAMPTVSNDRYLYVPEGDGTLVADLAAGRVIGQRSVQGLQELLSPTYALGAGCR